jgi:O-antigen ligase
VAGLVVVIAILEGFVANYTSSGSLFDRIVATTFEKGFIPDTRSGSGGPWLGAIERGMKHPWFGQGPGWDFTTDFNTGFWPHNLYLFYFDSIGIFGLLAFLFFIYRIIKSTTTSIKASVVNSSFPEALMKIFHVIIVIFLFDQIKIEYLRNEIYTFFVWSLFGMIIATYNIIKKNRMELENPASP